MDVARYGSDFTVFTVVEVLPEKEMRVVRHIEHMAKKSTMETAGKVIAMDTQWQFKSIFVDDIGVGGGVTDRLGEIKTIRNKVVGVNVAKVAQDNVRFHNTKAEISWSLREHFEKEKIIIPQHKTLIEQLLKMKMEWTSSGKIKIIDPTDKSPDFFDSLMLTFYQQFGGEFFTVEL